MRKPVLWQVCVLVALGSLASHPCLAQTTTDCSTVADDGARLKCYDEQAARRKKAAAPIAATPPAVAPAAAAATPTPPQSAEGPGDFGREARAVRKKKTDAPEELVARVKTVTTRPRGAYLITLEDGQVWEETDHTSSSKPPDVGGTVTIKRGMLGSFFLSHQPGLAMRVKRID
jgi:hypothetical protein